MNFFPWRGRLAIIFLLVSLFFNLVLYAVFDDSNYIFKFILAQLGFLPISVYLVTVVINQLLGQREKQVMLKKLNMVIGSFFSEVGTGLLRLIYPGLGNKEEAQQFLLVGADWGAVDYQRALAHLEKCDSGFSHTEIDWQELRGFMLAEKNFLLSLLGNPNLFEHEIFTELLWAVFHLAEELGNRSDVSTLPVSDYEHLIGDINRVYVLLLTQWLSYMEHLQEDYPFLFSLAVRTNPFNPQAKAEIG
jgi:NADH:ubiquinone oxidoreductase subunit K